MTLLSFDGVGRSFLTFIFIAKEQTKGDRTACAPAREVARVLAAGLWRGKG